MTDISIPLAGPERFVPMRSLIKLVTGVTDSERDTPFDPEIALHLTENFFGLRVPNLPLIPFAFGKCDPCFWLLFQLIIK